MLDKNSVLLEFEPTFAKDDEVDLLMQYWYVGTGNSLIIFSSTTILNMADSNPVADIKNELPQILKSVTKSWCYLRPLGLVFSESPPTFRTHAPVSVLSCEPDEESKYLQGPHEY